MKRKVRHPDWCNIAVGYSFQRKVAGSPDSEWNLKWVNVAEMHPWGHSCHNICTDSIASLY